MAPLPELAQGRLPKMADPLIVEFATVTRQGFNWIPIAQTALGTLGGFVLGLVAFGIQRMLQNSADERLRDNSATDALKRLLSCAGANIETLVMLKMQLTEPLEPEITVIEKLIDRAYENDSHIHAMKTATE